MQLAERGITMKISACPFCAGATERGYIQSSRQIIWSGEKKEGVFLAGDGDIKITEGTLKVQNDIYADRVNKTHLAFFTQGG